MLAVQGGLVAPEEGSAATSELNDMSRYQQVGNSLNFNVQAKVKQVFFINC